MAGRADILQTIAARTRERVEGQKAQVGPQEMEARARACAQAVRAASATGEFPFPFEQALRAPGMSFICEVKRASPSRGQICADFDPVAIACDYERAGAAAVSCLTEPFWFEGSDDYLAAIARTVGIPVLRKDFVVDEYMIYQARVLGASAVLLICAILSDEQLARYVALCHELGMSALVEAYAPEEVPRALAAGARVVGVNNRDLRTFEVDFGRSARLRPLVGPERVFVSESGVETRADVGRLEEAGVDAVLVGETLMRAADRRAALAELRGPRAHGPAHEPTRVKLCGISRDEDVDAVLRAAPDMCGIVVDYPCSLRSVTPDVAQRLGRRLEGSGIERVGVFVDAFHTTIARLVACGAIDAVQLHGHEGPAYVEELRARLAEEAPGRRVRIIQAFRVRGPQDVQAARESPADLVLLDNGRGTGATFDWGLVADVGRPFILAGGLAPSNVGRAIAAVRPYAVDMSSGIETDGSKDPRKMIEAVAVVRAAGKELADV